MQRFVLDDQLIKYYKTRKVRNEPGTDLQSRLN